jgi:hypothetical protein
MANSKWQNSNGFTFAICYLPFEIAYQAAGEDNRQDRFVWPWRQAPDTWHPRPGT